MLNSGYMYIIHTMKINNFLNNNNNNNNKLHAFEYMSMRVNLSLTISNVITLWIGWVQNDYLIQILLSSLRYFFLRIRKDKTPLYNV